MKRVLQITTDLGQGGAERVFSQLSRELSKEFDVYDCVFNQIKTNVYHKHDKLIDLDVPATDNIVLKVFNFLKRIRRIKSVKKRLGIEVSISHLEGADYINILGKAQDKTVLCIHGSKLFDQEIKGVLGWLRLKVLIPVLYKKADHIIVVSKDIKTELVKAFKIDENKISVINNFFDLSFLKDMAKENLSQVEKSFFSKYDVIVSSGRLEVQKNHKFLIDVYTELHQNNSEIKLIVLGEGSLKSSLVDKAKNNGLKISSAIDEGEADIYFLGFQDSPFKLIYNSKIFMLTSLWEGFPLALCESLIVGTPVFTFDCPTGPREILFSDLKYGETIDIPQSLPAGVLFPILGDYDKSILQWVDNAVRILSSTDKLTKMSNEGKKTTRHLDKAVVIRNWVDLIQAM